MDLDVMAPDGAPARRSPDPGDARLRPRGRARRPAERGASLVEYALIVAVFAIGTVGAIELLQDGAATSTQNTADNISSGPR